MHESSDPGSNEFKQEKKQPTLRHITVRLWKPTKNTASKAAWGGGEDNYPEKNDN